MKKEDVDFEVENLKKILQKIETIINLNINGKFIVSHEKTIGVKQMLLNSILRMQSSHSLEKEDV
jgi:translation elongation factor EF-4